MPPPATAIDKSLLKFADPAAWDEIGPGRHYEENVPIFVAHDLYRKQVAAPDGKVAYAEVAVAPGQKPQGTGWQFVYAVTDDHLKSIADAINATYSQQDTPVVWKVGHTDVKNLHNQQAQPKPSALGVGACVGTLPGGRKAVLQKKLYHLKGCFQENKRYPFRSVEFDPTSLGISDVAFLATKPKLNMGALVYGDSLPWQQLYGEAGTDGAAALTRDGSWVSYGFDLPPVAIPYADEPPPGGGNGAPKPTDPPDSGNPADQGTKTKLLQLLSACLPEIRQMLGMAAAGAPTAPPAAPPAAPMAPPMPHPPMAAPPTPALAAPHATMAPPAMPPRPLTPPGATHMAAEALTLEILAQQNAKMQADFTALQTQYAAQAVSIKTQAEQIAADKAAQNVAVLWREGYEAFYQADFRQQEITYQATLDDARRTLRMAEIRQLWKKDTSKSMGDPTQVPYLPVLPGAIDTNPDRVEFGYSEDDMKHANAYMQEHQNCEWDDARRFALKKRLGDAK